MQAESNGCPQSTSHHAIVSHTRTDTQHAYQEHASQARIRHAAGAPSVGKPLQPILYSIWSPHAPYIGHLCSLACIWGSSCTDCSAACFEYSSQNSKFWCLGHLKNFLLKIAQIENIRSRHHFIVFVKVWDLGRPWGGNGSTICQDQLFQICHATCAQGASRPRLAYSELWKHLRAGQTAVVRNVELGCSDCSWGTFQNFGWPSKFWQTSWYNSLFSCSLW